MFSLNAALDAIHIFFVCVCDLNVLLELERKRTTASCGVCVCAFYFSFCLFVCFVVRAVDWSGVSRFGRWDGYRRRALWCEVVKAEGWALMIHTSLRERKHSSEGQRSLSSTSLVSFHPQNLSYLLLLFLLLSQKVTPAEHLGPRCTNLCWFQQWKQHHISKYL